MSELSHLTVNQEKEVALVGFKDATILDAYHVDAVSKELFALIEERHYQRIAIDMSTIQMISSQTLGVFLQMRQKMEPLGGRMVICGIDPKLYRVFKITNLTSVFQFYEDRDSAVQSFQEERDI